MNLASTSLPKLVASYWTIAGYFPGRGADHSQFSFLDRVIAAREAGFCGIGLLDTDLEHVLHSHSLQECKSILDDQGLTHIELEFLVDWFQVGEQKRLADARKKFLFDASEILKPQFIKVGDFSRSICPMPRLIDSYGKLCEEAQERGTKIAFEPMGAAVVHNLSDALTLVRGTAARNGGLAIDIWHMVNLEIPFEDVSKIPKEYLFCVELNDAKIDPQAETKPCVDRRFCGEGDLDIKSFIDAIRRTGFDQPWGIELFSDELVGMNPSKAANKAFQTTIAQFS